LLAGPGGKGVGGGVGVACVAVGEVVALDGEGSGYRGRRTEGERRREHREER